MQDDEALIARIALGNPAAMAEFYTCWFGQFVRLATRQTGNPDAAEDIAQDTVIQVITRAGTYVPGRGTSPRAWMLTILHNRVCDWARRKEVRRAQSVNASSEDDEGGPRAIEIPAREPSAEERLSERERDGAMRAALEKLTDTEREVILMRDYSGLSAPQTASALGISVERVGSRLFRARKRLGTLLQTDWPGLFPSHDL
jgi:RNA polymerase sigma-70 factor (ECF subfamily)